MISKTPSFPLFTAWLLASGLIAGGCASSPEPPGDQVVVKGRAMLNYLTNCDVQIYAYDLSSKKMRPDAVATLHTDVNGAFSGTVPYDLVFEARIAPQVGCTYVDEASKIATALTSTLRACVVAPPGASSVNVTLSALTPIAAGRFDRLKTKLPIATACNTSGVQTGRAFLGSSATLSAVGKTSTSSSSANFSLPSLLANALTAPETNAAMQLLNVFKAALPGPDDFSRLDLNSASGRYLLANTNISTMAKRLKWADPLTFAVAIAKGSFADKGELKDVPENPDYKNPTNTDFAGAYGAASADAASAVGTSFGVARTACEHHAHYF